VHTSFWLDYSQNTLSFKECPGICTPTWVLATAPLSRYNIARRYRLSLRFWRPINCCRRQRRQLGAFAQAPGIRCLTGAHPRSPLGTMPSGTTRPK